MPLPLLAIIPILGGLLLAAAIAYWGQVCTWFAVAATPWLKERLPKLQPFIAKAFKFIDDKIVTPVRRQILGAWRKVRPHLLSAVIEIKRTTKHEWVRELTIYLQQKLEGPVTRQITEVELDWADLPEDVRARMIAGRKLKKIDFTKLRDKEVQAAIDQLEM